MQRGDNLSRQGGVTFCPEGVTFCPERGDFLSGATFGKPHK